VLENAINVVQDACDLGTCGHSNLRVLTFPLLFRVLRRLSQPDASIDDVKPNQRASSSSTATTVKKEKVNKPKIPAKSRPVVSLPVGKDADQIYADVQSKLNGGHPFSRCKFVTCKTAACKFCRELFLSISLTPCKGHIACVPGGWYPHIGISLWQQLARKHDMGAEFICRTRHRPEGMPSLSAVQSPPSCEIQDRALLYSSDMDTMSENTSDTIIGAEHTDSMCSSDANDWSTTPLVTAEQIRIHNLEQEVIRLKIRHAKSDSRIKEGAKRAASNDIVGNAKQGRVTSVSRP
jgi:hypothetical protein